MRLRQIALAAAELEPTRRLFFELLEITSDYADPGVGEFGLVNSVMAIGDTFLEIVAPNQPNTAAGRMLDRRGVSCGYMLLMQVDDYAGFTEHLDAMQVRKIWETQRPQVSACHVHPKDIGAAIVSFDQMQPPESWLWAGPDWRKNRAQRARRIVGCEVQTKDCTQLAQRWGEIMQTKPQQHNKGLRLAFANSTFIDFVTGIAYEGISGITLEAEDPEFMYDRAAAMGLEVAAEGGSVAIGELDLRFIK